MVSLSPLRVPVEAEGEDGCRVTFELHRSRHLLEVPSLGELHLPDLDVGGEPCNQQTILLYSNQLELIY